MPQAVEVLSVIFPVFSIIAIGYLFASFKKIELDSIMEVLLYVTIPALVISSLARKDIVVGDLTSVALAAAGVVAGTALISRAYLSATNPVGDRRGLRGFYLSTMFMNSGNLTLPIALLAFGSEGLAAAVLYYVAISIYVYTLGIYVAKGSGGLGEIFKLPLLYATAIGIAINLTGTELPGPVLVTFDMLGAATIPLMQISLGYQLYSVKLSDYTLAAAASAIRIGGGLAAAYIMVTLLGIEGVTRKVVLLSSAMPSAVINFVLSVRYNVESEFVASTVAMSTLISVITIPLLLAWLM
ncbi:MAG: AEC family transporter [Thermodesulfobacteriota bacterium]